MTDLPYLDDIRRQPDSLSDLLSAHQTAAALAGLDLGAFDRVIVTGMGASHHANGQIWQDLVQAGVPAWWLETSDLLGFAHPLVTPHTLLWVTSQSGQSAEIAALMRILAGSGVPLVGMTNHPASPLGTACTYLLPLHAGPEHAVSTRTYVNTIAANILAFDYLTTAGTVNSEAILATTATALRTYLADWPGRLAEIRSAIGRPRALYVIGRGRSTANAYAAALTITEAAKAFATAMSGPQFRHGPIELAGPDLTAVFLEDAVDDGDRQLAADLAAAGTRVVWAGSDGPEGVARITPVAAPGLGAYVTQIVPLQLASLSLAEQAGVIPGEFVHARKVTTRL